MVSPSVWGNHLFRNKLNSREEVVEEGVGGEVGSFQETEDGDLPFSHPVPPLRRRAEVDGLPVQAHPPLHVLLAARPSPAHVPQRPERRLPPLRPPHWSSDQLFLNVETLKLFLLKSMEIFSGGIFRSIKWVGVRTL